MRKPLFFLTDNSPVFRGEKLHVHPSYWRKAGAVVTAEFECGTREAGAVVVRSDNGAVPDVPLAALTRLPHPDAADSMKISLLLDCDVHEVSRRDLKLWRASRQEAPAASGLLNFSLRPEDCIVLHAAGPYPLYRCMGCNTTDYGAERMVHGTGCRVEAALKGNTAPTAVRSPATVAQPVELRGVAETLGDGGGFWRSCSGCHELNEGHDTGPYSAVLKCHLGGGCSECGGIGAIWDTTDYADIAAFSTNKGDGGSKE